MTRDSPEHQPPLTPEEIDYTYLPDQTMYKIQVAEEDTESLRTYPLTIRTNEFRLLYFELDPAGSLDWHTHAPGFDEVNLCLGGSATYTLEREDGSYQTLEVGPMEFVYVPGGARHKIEVVSDEVHRSLSAAKFDSVARLEALEATGEAEDAENQGAGPQDALWIDRKRNEVVERDEQLVST